MKMLPVQIQNDGQQNREATEFGNQKRIDQCDYGTLSFRNRRLVGYGRLEGAKAAAALDKLHEIARLYVNFFQPSFKLKSKTRLGAKVSNKYEKPATPYERLLADDRVTSQRKDTLRQMFAVLDPVRLLSEIREAQRSLTQLEVGGGAVATPEAAQDLNRFVKSLSTAWREGEVRPTHRKTADGPRAWRTRVLIHSRTPGH